MGSYGQYLEHNLSHVSYPLLTFQTFYKFYHLSKQPIFPLTILNMYATDELFNSLDSKIVL